MPALLTTREKGSFGLVNRPALWMAAALALGITAADLLRPHPALALAAVLLAAGWAARANRRLVPALLLTVSLLGTLRYAWVQTGGRGDLALWEGTKVTLVGTIVSDPELRQPRGGTYIVQAEEVEGRPAAGKVSVTQFGDKMPRFGERVEMQGSLKPPPGPKTPGGFDRAAYLARQGVYLTLDTGEPIVRGPGRVNLLRRVAVAARLRLEASLRASLPERDAALMAGLLLGSRADLPGDIKEAFRASGVFHLLAVSGGNLAMVIAPLVLLLRRAGLSKRAAAAAGIPAVIFFVFLTGAGPSVTRAGFMALLVLLGTVLRREKDAVNTLGAAVSILLLSSPGLLFDLGFQLSVCATLGILLFARPIEQRLTPVLQKVLGEKVGHLAAQGLSVTFGAQLLVEPISLYNFGAFSTIAPVANLLVLLFLEPVVQLGSVAAVAGLVVPTLATLLNLPVRLGLWLLITLVKGTSLIPGAYLEVGRLPAAWAVAWYAVLAVVAVPALRTKAVAMAPLAARARSPRRALTAAAALGLLLATGFTWRIALAAPPDTLTVTFLDVGQGDAVVIQAPGGKTMLIDAGAYLPDDPKTGRPGYNAGADVVVPFLESRGIRRLDYFVLTHPDLDHAGGGSAVLQSVKVGAVLKSDDGAAEARKYLEALAEAAKRKIPVLSPAVGGRIDMGGGVLLDVIGPPAPRLSGTRSDDNANCVAFRLTYRKVSMLLTCDFEAESEEYLLARNIPLKADLLKVAHHGSGHSSTEPFLAAVRPKYAIVSAGNGNAYGHPHKDTVQRLADAGATIYRTDRHGTITVRTNGLTFDLAGTRGNPEDDQYKPLGLLGRRLLRAW
ncbi:MAG: ComE-like competence protein [Symbiobacteriaceae bacterium]|jgi:competence protein ComEC|nr:ComE-like competence protein [Symbiobacteriaceae bacterium]